MPWRGGCPHRRAARDFLATLYRERHPGWSVITGRCTGEGPWSKGLAVLDGLAQTNANVVIVADADVWCDGLADAVTAVQAGASWAVPHTSVHRLNPEATAAVLRGADWNNQPLDQRPYRGIFGGGYVVAHRGVIHSIPPDPRYTGWG